MNYIVLILCIKTIIYNLFWIKLRKQLSLFLFNGQRCRERQISYEWTAETERRHLADLNAYVQYYCL